MHLRRLPLKTLYNARELGGYPCAGGGTRWGVFLRADKLSGLCAQDMEWLMAYGLTTVIDLRDAQEIERGPNSFARVAGVTVHNIPLIPLDVSGEGTFSFGADVTLADLYAYLLERAQPAIGRLFTVMARAPGVCLFHCTAGKDRTGVTAALLLSLCGVSAYDVVSDYQVSNTYLEPRIALWRDQDPVEHHRFYLSDAQFMRRTLALLETEYSGTAMYLQRAGLMKEDRERLIEKFVERG